MRVEIEAELDPSDIMMALSKQGTRRVLLVRLGSQTITLHPHQALSLADSLRAWAALARSQP